MEFTEATPALRNLSLVGRTNEYLHSSSDKNYHQRWIQLNWHGYAILAADNQGINGVTAVSSNSCIWGTRDPGVRVSRLPDFYTGCQYKTRFKQRKVKGKILWMDRKLLSLGVCWSGGGPQLQPGLQDGL